MAGNMWQQQQPPINSMVTFINDDSEAISYPVNPGMTVALINANDPENSKMFLKSSAANGCPNPMRIFKIQDITPQKNNGDMVSRKEFDSLQQQLRNMQQLLMNLQQPQAVINSCCQKPVPAYTVPNPSCGCGYNV